MKKLIALAVVLVASATVANAQFGIIAGVNSSVAKLDTEQIDANFGNIDKYHVGVAAHIDLPLGFALQPQLTYSVKGTNLQKAVDGSDPVEVDFNAGFLELGVGAQWGIDLIAIRPFALFQPFIGYQLTEAITNNTSEAAFDMDKELEKLEYGFAIGAGVELIEHLQLSVKWFKNLGSIGDKNIADGISENWSLDTASYQGFQVTLGLFF